MKSVFKWILRALGVLLGLVVLLLVVAFFVVNSNSFQQRMLDRAVTLLEEKLQTHVAIDSVNVDLWTLDAALFGLCIEDRQQRPMLRADLLKANVNLLPLLDGVVCISEVRLRGIHTELHFVPHDPVDSIPNYQFVLDAFKADHKPDKKVARKELEKSGQKLAFNTKRVTAEDINVRYNSYNFFLGNLFFRDSNGKPSIKVGSFSAQWERTNKKGRQVSNSATITTLFLGSERQGHWDVSVNGIHFQTDNGHPRKNAGNPKRGFFDLEHLNAYANLKGALDFVTGDSVRGRLLSFTARDTIMGFDIRQLQTAFSYDNQRLHLKDFLIRQVNTELRFERGLIELPDKKNGRSLAYHTSVISGRTQLRDISRTFAPMLSSFTEPLNLKVVLDGDDEGMTFRNIRVSTDDKQLTIAAQGNITGLKDKYKLRVHIDVGQMVAKGGSKERLIKQFPVKRFMMKQLHALGTLHYQGSFNVLWKKEEFQGRLGTAAGALRFYFALNEKDKYLSGHAATDSIEIGHVMDMPDIGPVAATATFKIDISKPRTAMIRKRLGGKLPIGEVKAHITKASYKFVRTHDLTVSMVSDGAIAKGSLDAPGKFVDLSCDFSFTNTSEMQKMKVKPRASLHLFAKKSDEQKAQEKTAKAQEKAAKALQKAEAKQRKADAKAAKKAAKAQRKAAKKGLID